MSDQDRVLFAAAGASCGALLLSAGIGAIDPIRHSWTIVVALILEFGAAAMHLLRAGGRSIGGVALFRPAQVELGEGLYHLGCGLTLLAVVPWVWSGVARATA